MTGLVLIGQYDSPFVRRVGIALRLYGMNFEHRSWSVFGDAEKIRPLNPLVRVPTLVLDDGTVLTDSAAILDYLDSQVPEGHALLPRREPARHKALRITALACGMAEKSVSLFYERRLHDRVSDVWVARCKGQIEGVLTLLESELTGDWFGPAMGHADIAFACAHRFTTDAHPGVFNWHAFPRLTDLSQRLHLLPFFAEISQPFIPPA